MHANGASKTLTFTEAQNQDIISRRVKHFHFQRDGDFHKDSPPREEWTLPKPNAGDGSNVFYE